MMTNGCICYMLTITCKSCINREMQAKSGNICRKCSVGIWTKNGDFPEMRGYCTNCYYEMIDDGLL